MPIFANALLSTPGRQSMEYTIFLYLAGFIQLIKIMAEMCVKELMCFNKQAARFMCVRLYVVVVLGVPHLDYRCN